MPILIVLLLTGAVAQMDWPEPADPVGPAGSLAGTAAATLLPVLASALLARWAASAVTVNPSRRSEIAATYVRTRRRLGWLNLILFAVAVGLLGWGHTVWRSVVVDGRLVPFGELLVPAPYLLAVFAMWAVHFDAERALHLAADPTREFWSRPGHFGFNLRPFALLVLLPVVLFAGQQSFNRFAPEAAGSLWTQLAGFALVPLMFVFLPLVVKPTLGLQPMPAGPVRSRLEALAAKLNFRCRDLLVWPTRGSSVNAMVVGVVPQARYVIFTDRLLDALEPDEIDAVFGHEVGHVKHGHIPYYAAFFLLSATVTTAAVWAGLIALGYVPAQTRNDWVLVPTLAVMAGYVFVAFGFLSRKCERQADVYGVKAAALMRNAELGMRIENAAPIRNPSSAFRVSSDGVNAMVRALERVAVLNGMDTTYHNPRTPRGWLLGLRALLRAWQHGTIPDRIHFLIRLAENPGIEPGFQWRVFGLRCGLLVALAGALVALGETVGWATLGRML